MWLGLAWVTQAIFVLNLERKIAHLKRLENWQAIRQERREGFADDKDTLYAELQTQLGNQTLGHPALLQQTPIDTHVSGLGRLENSQNRSQEPETSLDLSQLSIDLELMFLDSDPGSKHGSLGNAGVAVDSQMTNHSSRSVEDSQSR